MFFIIFGLKKSMAGENLSVEGEEIRSTNKREEKTQWPREEICHVSSRRISEKKATNKTTIVYIQYIIFYILYILYFYITSINTLTIHLLVYLSTNTFFLLKNKILSTQSVFHQFCQIYVFVILGGGLIFPSVFVV